MRSWRERRDRLVLPLRHFALSQPLSPSDDEAPALVALRATSLVDYPSSTVSEDESSSIDSMPAPPSSFDLFDSDPEEKET